MWKVDQWLYKNEVPLEQMVVLSLLIKDLLMLKNHQCTEKHRNIKCKNLIEGLNFWRFIDKLVQEKLDIRTLVWVLTLASFWRALTKRIKIKEIHVHVLIRNMKRESPQNLLNVSLTQPFWSLIGLYVVMYSFLAVAISRKGRKLERWFDLDTILNGNGQG